MTDLSFIFSGYWKYTRLLFQPYLKEILQEICVYNMKAPHKNMWELKPEFRHYKQTETS